MNNLSSVLYKVNGSYHDDFFLIGHNKVHVLYLPKKKKVHALQPRSALARYGIQTTPFGPCAKDNVST